MTKNTPNQQDTVPGSAGAAPDENKMPAGCGAMMAEMMKKHGAQGHACAPGGETDEPAQDATGKEAGCGCGAMMERMMGKYFKNGTGKAGEQH